MWSDLHFRLHCGMHPSRMEIERPNHPIKYIKIPPQILDLHTTRFHTTLALTVALFVDCADPLHQRSGPPERRAQRQRRVTAPLRKHDIVPPVLQGHFETSVTLEGFHWEFQAEYSVFARPVSLASQGTSDLDGGSVRSQGQHARLKGNGRAICPPGHVSSFAVAARLGQRARQHA